MAESTDALIARMQRKYGTKAGSKPAKPKPAQKAPSKPRRASSAAPAAKVLERTNLRRAVTPTANRKRTIDAAVTGATGKPRPKKSR